MGNRLYFDDKSMDITDEDMAKFRFIAVGDTAYMIQNKATGLFLKAAGTSGPVSLSVHPTLFNVKAIGYGENLISGTDLKGNSMNNLHAQRDNNVLVTWSDAEAGSNSGLYIEDISETVADDYAGDSFNMSILAGEINTFCFPVAITATTGTIYGVEVEGTTVTLKPAEGNGVAAGVPFIYINGSTEDYKADATADEYDVVGFTHDYTLTTEPKTWGVLTGSFTSETIGAGKIVANGNVLETSKKSNTKVAANSAYIDGEYDLEAEVTLVISGETIDGIQTAVAKVAKDGNIYTVDGRLVGKGNLNTLKTMGRGIYVINGVKVMVK